MNVMECPLEYDKVGRLKYNPEFHTETGKRLTEEELEYLCKYYEIDGSKSISMALGRTEAFIQTKVKILRKKGLYEYYKKRNHYWSA